MNPAPPFGAPGGPPLASPTGPAGYGPPGAGPGLPSPGPARSSANVVIIIAVIFAVVMACGVFASLGVFGFRRYLERARAAAVPDGGMPRVEQAEPGGDGGTPAGAAGRVVRSADGRSQIALPESWRELNELNAEATIQIGSPTLDEYLMVLSEAKEDFSGDMTLQRFADINLGNMKGKVTSPEVSPATAVTVQGRPGLQLEMRGTIDELNVAYLITYVDGQRLFHQVIAWTRRSKFAGSRPRFVETTASFRER